MGTFGRWVRLVFTLVARGFSCGVSGFGQVLKSDLRFFLFSLFFLAASPLLSSAFGRQNEVSRRTGEKNLWYTGYLVLGLHIMIQMISDDKS